VALDKTKKIILFFNNKNRHLSERKDMEK